jgi:hypothetical protein
MASIVSQEAIYWAHMMRDAGEAISVTMTIEALARETFAWHNTTLTQFQ